MGGGQRISVRLDSARLARLQKQCEATGQDISHVVRQALDAYLASGAIPGDADTPTRRLSPPEEIMDVVPKYRDGSLGDLRKVRNQLFLDLLAAAFTCKQLYKRTPEVVEGYEGLLQLCQHFGIGSKV